MKNSENRRAVVAITGASGATIAVRLMRDLALCGAEVFCIESDASKKITAAETGFSGAKSALESLCPEAAARARFFGESDWSAPPASGSFEFSAMAVVPCSMKTLGKLAHSIADNLVVRAAEVALKERRRLVVCPRETPLALTHIRNMETLCLAGAVILPPVISFYNKPKTADDAADFLAARVALSMGFKPEGFKEWGL